MIKTDRIKQLVAIICCSQMLLATTQASQNKFTTKQSNKSKSKQNNINTHNQQTNLPETLSAICQHILNDKLVPVTCEFNKNKIHCNNAPLQEIFNLILNKTDSYIIVMPNKELSLEEKKTWATSCLLDTLISKGIINYTEIPIKNVESQQLIDLITGAYLWKYLSDNENLLSDKVLLLGIKQAADLGFERAVTWLAGAHNHKRFNGELHQEILSTIKECAKNKSTRAILTLLELSFKPEFNHYDKVLFEIPENNNSNSINVFKNSYCNIINAIGIQYGEKDKIDLPKALLEACMNSEEAVDGFFKFNLRFIFELNELIKTETNNENLERLSELFDIFRTTEYNIVTELASSSENARKWLIDGFDKSLLKISDKSTSEDDKNRAIELAKNYFKLYLSPVALDYLIGDPNEFLQENSKNYLMLRELIPKKDVNNSKCTDNYHLLRDCIDKDYITKKVVLSTIKANVEGLCNLEKSLEIAYEFASQFALSKNTEAIKYTINALLTGKGITKNIIDAQKITEKYADIGLTEIVEYWIDLDTDKYLSNKNQISLNNFDKIRRQRIEKYAPRGHLSAQKMLINSIEEELQCMNKNPPKKKNLLEKFNKRKKQLTTSLLRNKVKYNL